MVKFEIVQEKQKLDDSKVYLWLEYAEDGRVLLMSQKQGGTDYCEVEIKPNLSVRLVKFGNFFHGGDS